MKRSEILAALKESPDLDVLIVGAGVNGIATFRDLGIDAVRDGGTALTFAADYTTYALLAAAAVSAGKPLHVSLQELTARGKPLPADFKLFPTYLRAAGYYASNNVKEDYNFATPRATWDESSNRAHWRKRTPGQPFFSVFNFVVTHQSQLFCSVESYRGDPRRLTPAQKPSARL